MTDQIPLPHEKLLAYQLALELLKQVQGMSIVDARLRDQILRAAESVCLNIAEGVGRVSDADKKRVYAIARGECCETAAAIDVARAAGDCDSAHGRAARDTAGRVYALLTGASEVLHLDEQAREIAYRRERPRIEIEPLQPVDHRLSTGLRRFVTSSSALSA